MTPSSPEDEILEDLRLSPEEELVISAAKEASEEEYDFTLCAEKIAKSRGQIVVWPQQNELQIDIDSAQQMRDFTKIYNEIGWCYEWTFVHKSRSGPNRWHVYIRHPKLTFTTPERLLLQAFFQDDPKRCKLNTLRYLEGIETPSRLFEKPDFSVNDGVRLEYVVITPEPSPTYAPVLGVSDKGDILY